MRETSLAPRSKLTAPTLVASVLLALGLASAPAQAEPPSATFHNCGDIPTLTTWDIEAKRTKCGLAKRVARVFVTEGLEDGDDAAQVLGFSCRPNGSYYDGGYYRCTAKGPRVIKFTRGV